MRIPHNPHKVLIHIYIYVHTPHITNWGVLFYLLQDSTLALLIRIPCNPYIIPIYFRVVPMVGSFPKERWPPRPGLPPSGERKWQSKRSSSLGPREPRRSGVALRVSCSIYTEHVYRHYLYIYIYIYIYLVPPPIDLGFCCASCPETTSFHEFGSKNLGNYW